MKAIQAETTTTTTTITQDIISSFFPQWTDISSDPSTVGIDIVKLSPSSRKNYNNNNKAKVEAHEIGYEVWDFAGQLEYSSLHPVSYTNLFLNQTTHPSILLSYGLRYYP